MSTLLQLFIEFFKIGLFSVGGGLATLPFLYELTEKFNWYTAAQLADFIAISESTPGPIGINMATFAGYHAAGILGSIVATFAIVLPSLIIVMLIARALKKFSDSKLVKDLFIVIKPVVTALILTAILQLIKISLFYAAPQASSFFNLVPINLFFYLLILFTVFKYRKSPIIYIIVSAIMGIIFKIST